MDHVEKYLTEFVPQIEQLRSVVADHESFLIVGHNRPDGDCIGSMLAVSLWLQKQGKTTHCVVPSARDSLFDRVPGIDTITYIADNKHFKRLPKTQVTLLVDFSSVSMLSDASDILLSHPAEKIVCIDHHIAPNVKTDLIIDDITSSSCAELLREIMTYLHKDLLDKQIASHCYMGLVTDTGGPLSNGLEFEKDTMRSLDNMMSMMSYGVDKTFVLQQLGKLTLNRLQLATKLLTTVRGYGKVLRCWYRDSDAKQFGDDTGKQLALDMMRKVEGYPITLRFCIYDTYVTCSLRCVAPYDVQAIAKQFGGGGHIQASAFKLQGSDYTPSDLADIVKKIQDIVQQQLSPSVT